MTPDADLPGDRSVTRLHGLQVAWRQELEGGGRGFGQDFIPLVGHLFGRVNRLLEFCAGPGYIGFSLLAHGLCDHLVLSDVNPRAIEVMRDTVGMNELEDKVTIYESDGLDGIPSDERWDLVVANPPHFPAQLREHPSLVTDDPGWRLHRDFYLRVGDFLAPGGSVLLQENSEGSTPDDFVPMLADGGLSRVRTIWYTGGRAGPNVYYLWSKKTLPGLALEDEASTVTIRLGVDAGAPVAASAGVPLAVRLLNETGRPIRPHLRDHLGADVLWLRLDVIAAGGEGQLPLVALRPGKYDVLDSAQNAVMARLLVE